MKQEKQSPRNKEKQDRPAVKETPPRPKETGGPAGPDPTRYGDWERGGKCVDF